MEKKEYILGIESSCDDTSAAVLQGTTILSNIVANQEVHKAYGGVVPELASRSHQQHILPVVQQALNEAKCSLDQLSAIAFTVGPGLLGSLHVGTAFAKSMGQALRIPIIGVNHLQGHVLSHFIDDNDVIPTFPFLCLTVSGGHTQLVLVKDHLNMEIVGNTLDDAAGEAFDKTAKMFGLKYPGGPLIDKYAQLGDDRKFTFPKPKISGLNFSYSGLKTAILYFVREQIESNPSFIEENLNDLCASVQRVIVDSLIEKVELAAMEYNVESIAVGGGVSANSLLRSEFKKLADRRGWRCSIPKFAYCTDNAAMIAIVGYYMLQYEKVSNLDVIPRAKMDF